jgi:sulfite reductase alpha subunit-like flavoprotein
MQRQRLRWTIDRPARLWIAKTARKHLWKVITRSYDLDDLIQDAYLKWYYISQKYPSITERRHMMGLFQIAFLNHIRGLATKRSRTAALDIEYDDAYSELLHDGELATMQVLSAQAPPPVKAVLKFYSSDKNCRRLRSRPRAHLKQMTGDQTLQQHVRKTLLEKQPAAKVPSHETMNQKLARLCKLKFEEGLHKGRRVLERTDLTTMLKEHFS